jgi:membrane protein implicated in regulation of membrane protease activity
VRPAVLACIAFLLIVAVAHLVRAVLAVPIVVAEITVPMWPSWLAFVGLSALAIWLWRDQRTDRQ